MNMLEQMVSNPPAARSITNHVAIKRNNIRWSAITYVDRRKTLERV